MSSPSSVVALGLGSQPSCSALPVQRSSLPELPFFLPRRRSLALFGHQDLLESLSGSFCDVNSSLGPDPFDCSCSLPDPQLIRRIVSQVEFYLSDENLAKDAFLLKHVQKNKMGFVSIKLLTSFKKVKYLTRDWRLTLYALQFSELLEVNEEGTKVRRRIPIPESLLSIPPSKLLLAWDLLPQEQSVLPPLQKNFIETITRMFSPFGAIASIRILRPGRKPPSDVRKYTARYPELLTKCCALVEYENLESARKAFEDLNHQTQGPVGRESIKVVHLSGKGSKKKSRAEREAMENEELADKLGWKAQAGALPEEFPYGLGESLLRRSLEAGGAPVSPPLPVHKFSSSPTWSTSSSFKPCSYSSPYSGSLLASKIFPPLATELGNGGSYGLSSSLETQRFGDLGWESSAVLGSTWAPWQCGPASSPPPEPRPPPCPSPVGRKVPDSLSLRAGVIRLPHGPDGTKGFYNGIGRGRLVLGH
ncbi:la-related protein 6-like [Nothoprocta perdicaria]|uniref:la-related protein 6-like n=1 Tax=Nothoprocta perdicaria TaxID=30464 RepID=UPI000E1BBDBE|nr:la-related protein 6-like [Nothoprocta perdicaria]